MAAEEARAPEPRAQQRALPARRERARRHETEVALGRLEEARGRRGAHHGERRDDGVADREVGPRLLDDARAERR